MDIRKTAMVTICGRPNVGKSTLTNALVGEKIAIVSNKPQTTRNRICGVVNRDDVQFVFLDTPGFHKAKNRLGDYMVKVARESIADVDAAVLLVEPVPHVGIPEQELVDGDTCHRGRLAELARNEQEYVPYEAPSVRTVEAVDVSYAIYLHS